MTCDSDAPVGAQLKPRIFSDEVKDTCQSVTVNHKLKRRLPESWYFGNVGNVQFGEIVPVNRGTIVLTMPDKRLLGIGFVLCFIYVQIKSTEGVSSKGFAATNLQSLQWRGLIDPCPIEPNNASFEQGHGNNLRLQLHHVYSSCSPIKRPANMSLAEVAQKILASDVARENSYTVYSSGDLLSWVASGETIGTGNYIVRVGFGTPSSGMYVLIDTGSDITWIQCDPCPQCYKQRDALFQPMGSTSYRALPCNSTTCQQLKSFAKYRILHLDVDMPIKTSSAFGEVFSYCFPSVSSSVPSGFLHFGEAAILDYDVQFTPFVGSRSSSSQYFIKMTNVSVGDDILAISTAIMVDSGTVISRLEQSIYGKLRDTFNQNMPKLQIASPVSPFDTCFQVSSIYEINIPLITLHFQNNVDLHLTPVHVLYPADEGVMCFAFAPSSSGRSVLGNFQQQTYKFVYDIPNARLGISALECN
ncbi:hypothetical protein SUGI_0258950 [Cryptomeria japonica]|nr:hypothetical protein SUGI_0258950 [Cryptomeria japonica]